MIFGKYGEMILTNMENNYPYRKKELELTGELEVKIFEREKYILELKEQVEKQIKEKYKEEISCDELNVFKKEIKNDPNYALNYYSKICENRKLEAQDKNKELDQIEEEVAEA